MCAYAADWVLEYLSTRIVYVCIHLTSCLSTPTRWLSKNIRVSPFGTTFPRPTLINYVRIDLLRSLHTAHAREKPEEFTTTTITTTTTTTRNSSGIFRPYVAYLLGGQHHHGLFQICHFMPLHTSSEIDGLSCISTTVVDVFPGCEVTIEGLMYWQRERCSVLMLLLNWSLCRPPYP